MSRPPFPREVGRDGGISVAGVAEAVAAEAEEAQVLLLPPPGSIPLPLAEVATLLVASLPGGQEVEEEAEGWPLLVTSRPLPPLLLPPPA